MSTCKLPEIAYLKLFIVYNVSKYYSLNNLFLLLILIENIFSRLKDGKLDEKGT